MISGCVVCQCPCALEAHENELAKIMLSKQMKEAAEKKKGDGNDGGLLGLLQGLASSREQANLTPSVQHAHGGRVSFSSGSSSNSSSSSCSGSHFERMSTNLMKRGMTDTARREFQNHVKPTTTLKPGGQEFQVAAATNGTSARTRRRHDANRLHGNPNKAAVDVVEIDGSEDEHEGSSDCLDLGLDLSGGNEFMGFYGGDEMLQWCPVCRQELDPRDPVGSATHMSMCSASSSSSSFSSRSASAPSPAPAPRLANSNGSDDFSDNDALCELVEVKKLIKKELRRKYKSFSV